MKPIDSSSGVVCALPTTKLPATVDEERVGHRPAGRRSPAPAGSRSAMPHLGREPIEPQSPDSSRPSPEDAGGTWRIPTNGSVALAQLQQARSAVSSSARRARHRAAEANPRSCAGEIGDGVLVDAEQRRRGPSRSGRWRSRRGASRRSRRERGIVAVDPAQLARDEGARTRFVAGDERLECDVVVAESPPPRGPRTATLCASPRLTVRAAKARGAGCRIADRQRSSPREPRSAQGP